MPNYFYLDASGQKQGPINDQQLQALAIRGIIAPTTPMITDTGHKGVAGQIRGLFNAPPPQSTIPTVQQPMSQSVPAPVTLGSTIPTWAIIAGVVGLLVVGILAGSMMSSNSPTSTIQMTDVQNPPTHQAQAIQTQFTAAEQTEIERFLGEYGNDLQATRSVDSVTDITMLHNAAQYGTLAVVKYLVSQGLSVHARDSKRSTPLNYATKSLNVEIAEFLISKGADVNVGALGQITSSVTDFDKRKKFFELLISRGAKIDKVPDSIVSGSTNLDEREKMLELLTSHGAKVNSNALHTLFSNSTIRFSFIRILAANGADVNAKARRGGRDRSYEIVSPLHMAAARWGATACEILIELGADVNARIENGAGDDDGSTVLYEAVNSLSVEVVQLLVSKGANVNTRNNRGKSPLDIARENEQRLISLGSRNQADTSIRDRAVRAVQILRILEGR